MIPLSVDWSTTLSNCSCVEITQTRCLMNNCWLIGFSDSLRQRKAQVLHSLFHSQAIINFKESLVSLPLHVCDSYRSSVMNLHDHPTTEWIKHLAVSTNILFSCWNWEASALQYSVSSVRRCNRMHGGCMEAFKNVAIFLTCGSWYMQEQHPHEEPLRVRGAHWIYPANHLISTSVSCPRLVTVYKHSVSELAQCKLLSMRFSKSLGGLL